MTGKQQAPLTPLIIASEEGSIKEVKRLVEEGADINKAPRGYTALNAAAFNNHKDIVDYLLEMNANLYMPENNLGRTTPFSIAMYHKNLDAIKLLYTSSANIIPDLSGSALVLAAAEGDVGIVDLIYNLGAPVNCTKNNMNNWQKNSALMAACENEHADVVKYLLKHGAEVDLRSIYEETALHIASMKGNVKIVNMLLEAGAEVNALDSRDRTPLYLASEGSFYDVIKLLMEHNAKPDVMTIDGCTAISVQPPNNIKILKLLTGNDALTISLLIDAVIRGDALKADKLLDKGYDVDLVDLEGRTALHWAVEQKLETTVEKIIGKMNNVNSKDKNEVTALHLASGLQNLKLITLLLEKGADPNSKDINGMTPLHWTVKNEGGEQAARLLIEHGPEVNAQNDYGLTTLHFAASMDDINAATLLLEKGADVNLKDNEGRTPLSNSRNKKLAELLKKNKK
ncbi:MAG: ankyrin repeat domain-containing protein [bacterium]